MSVTGTGSRLAALLAVAAIANYRKSLELNPSNANAVEQLVTLTKR